MNLNRCTPAEGSAAMSRWSRICAVRDIPALGARAVNFGGIGVAIFRTADDQIFALRDRCPHMGGPLSQGIVHGEHVTCPLHGWVIGLRDGVAVTPDSGCAARYEVRVSDGEVWVDLTQHARSQEWEPGEWQCARQSPLRSLSAERALKLPGFIAA
jgi:nitrite reductase (NADH) small subunit